MKKVIALSTIAFLSTSIYASTDLQAQIDTLTKKIKKLEKKQKKNTKKISAVNKLANNDNIKFDVDFRTSYDKIEYKTVSGKKYKNDGLYSNRLWLNMGYAPINDLMFKGTLSFNKTFGASPYNSNGSGMPQRGYGYDAFDWVVNENLTDDKLRVREAYWLWMPTLAGRGYTFSVGRRPATNGFLVNLRDDDKAKSPVGHIINMEFDGISISAKTGDISEGSYFKICLGRGLTNAKSRFDQQGLDYSTESGNLDNMDLIGAIAKLYDDGQYTAFAKYYRAFNVIGMTANQNYDPKQMTKVDVINNDGETIGKANVVNPNYNPNQMNLSSLGDVDGATLSLQVTGIGDEINDFLDETTVFASLAYSNTLPDNKAMLGSKDNKSGSSIYAGIQMPNTTGGKFGLEYNHGSKYWRSFTYAEDTMAGSKLAVRGSAYEVYWSQPLIKKIFSMQVRYTYLDYDYTGSNAFFGDGGTPLELSSSTDMAQAKRMGMDPVESASDLRVYFRYRY